MVLSFYFPVRKSHSAKRTAGFFFGRGVLDGAILFLDGTADGDTAGSEVRLSYSCFVIYFFNFSLEASGTVAVVSPAVRKIWHRRSFGSRCVG